MLRIHLFKPFQIILSRQYGSDGRFTFTSHTPGEHQICLHSNSTKMALFGGGKLVRTELMFYLNDISHRCSLIAGGDLGLVQAAEKKLHLANYQFMCKRCCGIYVTLPSVSYRPSSL